MSFQLTQQYTATFRNGSAKEYGRKFTGLVRHQLRQDLDTDEHSSVAIADSQSVKTTEKKEPVRWAALPTPSLAWEVYGFDGGKKVKGRKRHIVVDSQGLLFRRYSN